MQTYADVPSWKPHTTNEQPLPGCTIKPYLHGDGEENLLLPLSNAPLVERTLVVKIIDNIEEGSLVFFNIMLIPSAVLSWALQLGPRARI